MKYLSGFRNTHSSEALAGALPHNQNSPQKCAFGLYAEQLSGSAFTAPRHKNLKSWLYRTLPSVAQSAFIHEKKWQDSFQKSNEVVNPTQQRWMPLANLNAPTLFVDGLHPFLTNANPGQSGGLIYLYLFNQSSSKHAFASADGDFLFVPQSGAIYVVTEFGEMEVVPGEILVVPRGIKFWLNPIKGEARGYAIENCGAPFEIPELGPMGANGLANPRHFLAPTAKFSDSSDTFTYLHKFQNQMFSASLANPFNVAAWWGNYYPYKYDLSLFNTINTVSFDHPDPSIFTVLTSPSHAAGVANIDFVIFPERWMVAEHTFRPPYYHKNIMSEYMGLIFGLYDAKEGGFVPGGGSLHNSFSPHGPDANTFEKASSEALKPHRYEKTLAFMFESNQIYAPTELAKKLAIEDKNYVNCWQGLKHQFKV